jgi:glucosamine 6-phosphate synthetase-like amidotransferase/phosphosugar isomerase protein
MCLIIVKPQGEPFPKQAIENSWQHNWDGGGLAVISNNVAHVQKGFMDQSSMMQYIADIDRKYCVIMHTRFKTHGLVNEGQTHS